MYNQVGRCKSGPVWPVFLIAPQTRTTAPRADSPGPNCAKGGCGSPSGSWFAKQTVLYRRSQWAIAVPRLDRNGLLGDIPATIRSGVARGCPHQTGAFLATTKECNTVDPIPGRRGLGTSQSQISTTTRGHGARYAGGGRPQKRMSALLEKN